MPIIHKVIALMVLLRIIGNSGFIKTNAKILLLLVYAEENVIRGILYQIN